VESRAGPVALLAALAALATACGGGGDNAQGERTGPPSDEAAGVAACWKDAATDAKTAADEARRSLPDAVVRIRDDYGRMQTAAAARNSAEFERAYKAFFAGLKEFNAGGARFEDKREEARATLGVCTGKDAAGVAVDLCWKEVASTYEEVLTQAHDVLDRGGAELLFRVQNIAATIETEDPAAARRAQRAFSATATKVIGAARRYARAHERSEGLYERCAAS
jgi:hypothetical protein